MAQDGLEVAVGYVARRSQFKREPSANDACVRDINALICGAERQCRLSRRCPAAHEAKNPAAWGYQEVVRMNGGQGKWEVI
jgi:hypothetical protein